MLEWVTMILCEHFRVPKRLNSFESFELMWTLFVSQRALLIATQLWIILCYHLKYMWTSMNFFEPNKVSVISKNSIELFWYQLSLRGPYLSPSDINSFLLTRKLTPLYLLSPCDVSNGEPFLSLRFPDD